MRAARLLVAQKLMENLAALQTNQSLAAAFTNLSFPDGAVLKQKLRDLSTNSPFAGERGEALKQNLANAGKVAAVIGLIWLVLRNADETEPGETAAWGQTPVNFYQDEDRRITPMEAAELSRRVDHAVQQEALRIERQAEIDKSYQRLLTPNAYGW